MSQAHATESTPAERAPHGILLARLGHEATARFRRSLRPLNLSAQQFIVLKQLSAMGPTSQTALADAIAVDYSNLAGVTAELLARGLVDRARDEEDRRRYVVELTAEGRQLLADADGAIRSGEDDMLGALDEEDRERLWELLRRVADSLAICPDASECSEAEAATPEAC